MLTLKTQLALLSKQQWQVSVEMISRAPGKLVSFMLRDTMAVLGFKSQGAGCSYA